MTGVWSLTAEGGPKKIEQAIDDYNKLDGIIPIPASQRKAILALVSKTSKVQASGYIHDDGKVTMNLIVTPV